MKKILITCHPRSGSKYTHHLLQYLGYDSLFEKRNPRGFTVSWKHITSGNFESPCAEKEIICKFDKIIHQVRHPLKVISSSVTLWTMSMNYIAKFINLPDKIINQNNTILNCMCSWVGWNKLIEEKASWRYKIEDLNYIGKIWCNNLEIPDTYIPALPPKNCRKHKQLTWKDLFEVNVNKAQEVKELAFKYGYV